MPYSILKLDIIMSRWDEKDPLIDTWHEPEQKVIMGKRGRCFCFFHRTLQKHASFQNDSCDSLTCEFLNALPVVTGKLCWVHRKRNQEEQPLANKMKKLFLSSPWATARRADLVSTWGQLKMMTREAEGLLQCIWQDFIRDTVFGHSGQLPYSCESLCTLPICYIVR